MQNYKKNLFLPKNCSIFAFEMNKKTLFSLLLMCICAKIYAQNTFFYSQSPNKAPLHEMRAVWLTTIGGIDWPHSYAQTPTSIEKQKRELTDILDQLVSAGYNTILLQTRVRATTIFPSNMEPWDGCLSGFPGKSPGYDALEYAIDECHKRGMKLHAWIVSIPIGKWNKEGCVALRRAHPELVKKIGDEGFMNPEAYGTAEYIASFCKDVAERYDIDGIHLDYIRYPETWGKIKNYDKGRENITRIVTSVHNAVKSIKPWVVMSCSPIGKYADTKRMWSHGWNARDIVCQDAAQWLQDGLMDALFPMMYFKGNNFYPFAIDWMERSNGKVICPGLGTYFLDRRQKDWPLQDITQEMNVLRQYGMGHAHFRSKFFTDNTKDIYDYSKYLYCTQPSLQPSISNNASKPLSPSDLSIQKTKDGVTLISWKPSSMPDVDGREVRYNIYGSDSAPIDFSNSENLLMAEYDKTSITIPQNGIFAHYAIKATNRYGTESEPILSYASTITGEKKKVSSISSSCNLPYDGTHVWLNNCDVTPNQLIEIVSIVGNVQYLRITHSIKGSNCIDITLPSGHYSAYLVNKKKYRHKLGCINVPVKQ